MDFGLDYFVRQSVMRGWNQRSIAAAHVALIGRDWLGVLVALGLRSLGVGEITWFGRPLSATQPLAQFLLDSSTSTGARLFEAPCSIEFGEELDLFLEQRMPSRVIITSEDEAEARRVARFADHHGIPCYSAGTAGAGWLGVASPRSPGRRGNNQDPIISLIVAALIVDAVRETLVPLSGGLTQARGSLDLPPLGPWQPASQPMVLVGAGGIGTWLALGLAASHQDRLCLHIIDHDRCSPSNLNRQVLYTPEDARAGVPKAEALARTLSGLFPQAQIQAEAVPFSRQLRALAKRPGALLSAVDNARTRMELSAFARRRRLHLLHGGTSEFAADCYLQNRHTPTLNQQMHGVLKEAAHEEQLSLILHEGCCADPSYVVPSMMAAGLMAYRLARGLSDPNPLPICWRSGDFPAESDVKQLSRIADETFDALRRLFCQDRGSPPY